MASTKEATVIILDVGRSTGGGTEQGGKTFFQSAKTCIDRILQRKIFSQPHDEVALVLMGTDLTSNNLNSTLDGYEHIMLAIDLDTTNWAMLQVLAREVVAGQSEADWLDAIIVAIDVFKLHSTKKFKTFKIVIISPFRSAVRPENADLVIGQMATLGIELIVISDNIDYIPDPDDTDELNETAQFTQTLTKTPAQDSSQQLITRIITESNGVLCSFEQALVQLIYFEKKKQRSMPWNADLQIGSELKIKVSAYISVKDCSAIPWKTGAVDDQPCFMATEYLLNDKVIENPDQIGLIKGYMYGDSAVAFDAALRTLRAEDNGKCLLCFGFTSQASIRDEHFAGTGIWSVVAQPEFAVSEKTFAHLVAAMRKSKLAMLARYVYRNGLRPKVMALFPVDSAVAYKAGASLHMFELIYKENINGIIVPPLRTKKTEPSEEQIQAVDSLIDSMNLMDVSVDRPDVEAYANNKILNPATQHMYRVITHRALHPNQPIPVVDSDLNEHLEVPAKLVANAAPAVASLKALFPLERVVKPSKEQFFDRIKKITTSANVSDPEATNNAAPDDDGPLAEESRLVEVGTMTPAEDFGELLRRGEKFSTLCAQIQAVIADLVLKSVRVQKQKVAMAIMVYREEARLIGAWRYNEWIAEFKRLLVARHKQGVWQDIVVGERLGLITADDSETSTVSQREAQEFYGLAGVSGKSGAADGNEEDDGDDDNIDDLIGNM